MTSLGSLASICIYPTFQLCWNFLRGTLPVAAANFEAEFSFLGVTYGCVAVPVSLPLLYRLPLGPLASTWSTLQYDSQPNTLTSILT